MLKSRVNKVICMLLAAVSTLFVFNDGIAVYAFDDAADTEIIEEDIDPKHIEFVTRLYAIVTRQDHADEQV